MLTRAATSGYNKDSQAWPIQTLTFLFSIIPQVLALRQITHLFMRFAVVLQREETKRSIVHLDVRK
eukprot:1255920-Amphidinium_carterae.1